MSGWEAPTEQEVLAERVLSPWVDGGSLPGGTQYHYRACAQGRYRGYIEKGRRNRKWKATYNERSRLFDAVEDAKTWVDQSLRAAGYTLLELAEGFEVRPE